MKSLASLRDRLAKLAAATPKPHDGLFHGTSEQAFAEVRRLLAEVEANPATEAQPFNPSLFSPEEAALILEVERMQKTMVWSDTHGCLVPRETAQP